MLADLVQNIANFVSQIVITFGAPGITLIALLENLFPPTPSEFLYPMAGKLTYDGQISFFAVVLAGVIGSLIGSLIYYGLGYKLGEARVRAFIGRFGTLNLWRLHITLLTEADFDRGMTLFQKRGGLIVLLVRLMPLVHGVISIPAGVSRMRLLPFIVYTAIGSALWIAPLVLLGNFLGSQWERLIEWMDVYQNIWYIVIALAVVYWVVRRFRQSRSAEPIGTTAD